MNLLFHIHNHVIVIVGDEGIYFYNPLPPIYPEPIIYFCHIRNEKGDRMNLQRGAPRQTGTIHFDSNPRGALIYVDGQLAENPDTGEPIKTPATIAIIEGRRSFTFSLPGYDDEIGYINVMPNTTGNIYRNLKPGISEEGWGKPEPQIYLSLTDEEIRQMFGMR